jgi:hypothetical protein
MAPLASGAHGTCPACHTLDTPLTVPLISPVLLTAFPFVPILPDVCVLLVMFRINYTHLYSSWHSKLTHSIKFIFRCQSRQVICFRLYNVNTIRNFEFKKMWGIPWLACLCVFVTCRFIRLVPAMFCCFVWTMFNISDVHIWNKAKFVCQILVYNPNTCLI